MNEPNVIGNKMTILQIIIDFTSRCSYQRIDLKHFIFIITFDIVYIQ